MHNPYIGITDFMNSNQVHEMLKVFIENRRTGSERKLHVGVMMSYKTLHGLPTKWQTAFPPKETVSSIFLGYEYAGIFNVLHYADYDGIDVSDNLLLATGFGGQNLDALQLDMIWPLPEIVKNYRQRYPNIQIILQGNTKALEAVGNDIPTFIKRLAEYGDSIDFILLDKSMGRGLGMDAVGLIPIAQAINDSLPSLGLAAAGGLGPETLHLVEPMAKVFPNLSIDAQGKLRPSGNALDPIDWEMAKNYLIKALQLLG